MPAQGRHDGKKQIAHVPGALRFRRLARRASREHVPERQPKQFRYNYLQSIFSRN
jgi:hypothetical protein